MREPIWGLFLTQIATDVVGIRFVENPLDPARLFIVSYEIVAVLGRKDQLLIHTGICLFFV